MGSLRAIKRRITTSKSTAQITRAMQMVSASKMKKSEESAREAMPYADGIYEVVRTIGKIKDYKSPYLRIPKRIKKIAVVVIGPGRGFVGELISKLLLSTADKVEKLKKDHPDAEIVGISLHKVALKIVNGVGIDSEYHFAQYLDSPDTTNLSPIFKILLDGFTGGEFDEVYLSYMYFVNTMVQKPVFKKVLPISFEKLVEEAKGEVSSKSQTLGANREVKAEDVKDFIFEPSPSEVLDFLLPEYFETQILTSVLSSNASEHSARMVAMKNATDNANELVKNLTLKYNRSRQANITQEILEVAMGAAS